MGDKMSPMPFEQLLTWILKEYHQRNTVFGVHRPYQGNETAASLFGRDLETPVGPAAGPHTQLAQNIVAAYFAGSRFFELKTVQTLDGDDLPVSKPCIRADDECYNVEWSTELYVPQALEEYIKAWMLLKVMAKEFGLGSMDGFQFNMSVGYDLAGISSPKIDSFIEALKNAEHTEIFRSCKQYLLEHAELFRNVTADDIAGISPHVCNSATLSTLHGCPPQEIERIATYLLKEKGLHTFIKCNPTLLGYDFARKTLDEMGYDYIAFGEFHFKDDLQYEDAVPMLKRLMSLAEEKGLSFGVKLTNTFPVDIKQNELPGEEMYMSGKSLYPLSIALAARLSEEFGGKLRISYSGGADYYNIAGIAGAGIWPVTVATTLLKPGGYQRMAQIAETAAAAMRRQEGVDVAAVKALAAQALTDCHHVKAIKPLPSRKVKDTVPLTDCFMAPCKEGCPIHQDITDYMELAAEGRMEEALYVILEKNPLPFMTGTICAHNCMSRCTRHFYEEPVHIREMKLLAAKGGYDAVMEKLSAPAVTCGKKAAVIGGGPAGMAAAYFLRRAGMDVTLFEKSDSLGGVVRHVIPGFRIPEEAIEKDASIIKALGVKVELNTPVEDIGGLKAKGFDYCVVAVGASQPGSLPLQGQQARNALDFLAEYKKTDGQMDIGSRVCVIGGGNTAMDTARAAKRTAGVQEVSLIYRRTKRYMPADEEELSMALADGVQMKELLSPVSWEGGVLRCDVMELTDMDESGRRQVRSTGSQVSIQTDLVIAATGEQVPIAYFESNGLTVTDRKRASVDIETLAGSTEGVYIIGDCLNGPATVVEAIRDAGKAAEAILAQAGCRHEAKVADIRNSAEEIYSRRGILQESCEGAQEEKRCLSCAAICENCAEVCPNRANISINVPGRAMHQIIHVDYMCNECGNCRSFCPYDSAPYLDKFTLFASEADMENSKNQGFVVLDAESFSCKVRLNGKVLSCSSSDDGGVPGELRDIIKAVCGDYAYLLTK